ncbi:MAG: 2OG-Fe(II) oxygenase [Bacteroidia bacterium]|nr:2OG-Fe(II) oxygenase [Bacteroidia bacterium]
MNFFKNLFAKKTPSPETRASSETPVPSYVQEYSREPYNFETITLDELLKRDTSLWDLYTNQADGFLIKNFISEAEVDTIMSNFDKVLKDDPAYTAVGFTYPAVFAEFSNRIKQEADDKKAEAIDAYFKKTTSFNEHFHTDYGVDLKTRFENLFKAISGNRNVEVAEGMGGPGKYPFATVRLLTPDKGLMSVHCGNYFGKTFENFYKDLTKKVAVENQMSFFIMLQEPEAGGELSLFNFRWKTGQTKVNPSEDNETIQPDGSKMYVEEDKNIIKDKIVPKKGDMILFQGGNIWHRVETVRGSIPRITFGGFIGISIDKQTFYYWS